MLEKQALLLIVFMSLYDIEMVRIVFLPLGTEITHALHQGYTINIL
jgi:hypothetical protein